MSSQLVFWLFSQLLTAMLLADLHVGGDAVDQMVEGETVVIQLLRGFVIHVAEGVGTDIDFVGAHFFKILHALLVLALDHRDHDDHGGHADDDAQHGEKGTGLFAGNGFEGHFEGLP